MSACVPTPVSTAFSTVTGGSTITTTYSLSTSAVPPVVTTHIEPFCQNEAVVLDSTFCLRTGTRTSTETLQPPSDVVFTISYETTIPVTTLVPISTVYGGCSNNPSDPGGGGGNGGSPGSGPGGGSNNPGSGNGNGSGNPNGGPISVPPGRTLVTSSVLVYTTGPPETSMITSVTTLPNGQVTTTLIPTLVTPRPSQVYVPTTALVEETGMSGSGSPKGAKLGVVVGAVIGGFIGLCLIILALWYVRRRRKTTYDEILYEHEKQINDQEARRQAIERSKDPNRKRESDPKPTPYHYGSLLSGGGRIQTSTSTAVALSQNPFESTGVGNRATYLAPGSPHFTTMPTMGEFGAGSGTGVVGANAFGVEGPTEPINPSRSSVFSTSGTVPTMDSAPTLESSSGGSSDLDYMRSYGSAEFVEVDIGTGVVGRPRVISPPPHLSMSFGSWNSNTTDGRRSGGSKRSSGMDPGTDPGLGSSDGSRGGEEDDAGRQLLQPHRLNMMGNHTTGKPAEAETVWEGIRSHLRRRSGSPVSLAPPARGTLFIVNHRASEDL